MKKTAKLSPKMTNSRNAYGVISIGLHWLFAAGIIFLLASGLYMVTLDYYHPWYHPLPTNHKAVGIGLMVVYLLRTLWHLMHKQPEIQSHSRWEIIAAKATHKIMLLFCGIIFVTGYLIVSVDVTSVEWLGFTLPSIEIMSQQADQAGWWHEYTAYGLIGLIVLHLGATLKHQWFDHHRLLQKIVFPRR